MNKQRVVEMEQILASSSSMNEGQEDLDMIKRLVK
jgi:hypothetical protein